MMKVKPVKDLESLVSQVVVPRSITIDCAEARKGIDNYHVDVTLSAHFVLLMKELVEEQSRLLLAGKRLTPSNTEQMAEFRDSYTDMMRVTLHRTKTDLTATEIAVLQFGIAKLILQEVRDQLLHYESQLEDTLGQQQYAGSRSLLTTQERLQWFRKHKDEFLFRINRHIFRQLQREENNSLKKLRTQVIGDVLPESVYLMFNPLLFGSSPQQALLLCECYGLWRDPGAVNEAVEQILEEGLEGLEISPLRSTAKLEKAQAEVFDELGGLFAAQSLLGPADDQGSTVTEEFSWLEHPGNIRWLFDPKLFDKRAEAAKSSGGLLSGWDFKGLVKKQTRLLEQLINLLEEKHNGREALAAYQLRELTQQEIELLDLNGAAQLLGGGDVKRLLSQVGSGEGSNALRDKLLQQRTVLETLLREARPEQYLRLLTDLSRYRMHLRYYRLAHRLFNRINVITDPEKIQLARAGGNLYRLMDTAELKELRNEAPEIVHHTILKADVRGSTTVTQQLIAKDLNPASYFSLRFFGPINERLAVFGAVKVFIEGDAVILGFYEHEGDPGQWYSVARACGMAKDMIDIVSLNNAENRKTGLPILEIGIGICYADERPLFLYDEDRPIMISGAIGDADRMSSCSWKLRESFGGGRFNVEVLEIAEGNRQRGEKGQDYMRYNVNGVLIDQPAFEKLQSELPLKKVSVSIDDHRESFLVGRYPDIQGKERDLVVREGLVGEWNDEEISRGTEASERFYEVLPNGKLATRILAAAG